MKLLFASEGECETEIGRFANRTARSQILMLHQLVAGGAFRLLLFEQQDGRRIFKTSHSVGQQVTMERVIKPRAYIPLGTFSFPPLGMRFAGGMILRKSKLASGTTSAIPIRTATASAGFPVHWADQAITSRTIIPT
jgi:hypothetical protein